MDERYWKLELFEEHYKDLQDWVKTNTMVALVDEKAGGIVGYISRDHINHVIKELEDRK